MYILIIPLLSYVLPSRSDEWQVNILDVGQGVSVLVIKNNRALVYDVGAKYPSGFNMADAVILPILKAKGIGHIDWLFISHGDNDHAGSLPFLTQGIAVNNLVTNTDRCQLGFSADWQELNLAVLWPQNPINYSDNNGSCVMKISDGIHSVLLPGDIDKSIEQNLVELYGAQLKSTLLLAPHHGSNTSSTTPFIQTVDPEYVVFSQGFKNRWGFPKADVVTRYLNSGVRHANLYSISQTGQVRFVFAGQYSAKVDILTYRFDLYPYWYANMHNCCANRW
ncbi:MBL fold metallo-hydrolase [Paraglaciecola aquimarina]|uniref:MBL fold metallo-hydrolase n=1 Tax=Paraglaciecola aquimarina TaxID=1235557 RepID=A0ABU3SYG2_9ALTE|nr:MBL fold metallo-hydrolase [Paraglaciecola aquimarina]MDU0355040.1 MBL fold metallo-hydrolase [Paraglaciecola aquimarina]